MMTNKGAAKNSYTFRYRCDVCDQKPVLKDTCMCAVCTFGEADSVYDWIYEKWYGRELKAAQRYLKDEQRELSRYGMAWSPENAPRILEILSLKFGPKESA